MRGARADRPAPRRRPAAALAALAGALAAWPAVASTRSLNEEGNRAYRRAEFEQALRAYTEAQVRAPDSPVIQYNIGNVFYRQEEYERASEAYRKALEAARGPLARDSAYNLGNARFQAGDYAGAVAAYRGALQIDPADRDAKRNLEIALSLLELPPPGGGKGGDRKPEQKNPQEPQDGSASPRDSQPRDERGPASQEELDRQEAERLLDALTQEERENLDREKRKARAVQQAPGGKDW